MNQIARLLPALLVAPLLAACSGSSSDAAENGMPENNVSPSEARPGLTPDLTDGANDADGALPISFGPPECDECVADRCSGEVAVCTGNATCSDLLGCVSQCPAQSNAEECFTGCLLSGGNPPDELISLLSCLSAQCTPICGTSAG